jgi:hypothetical protein
MHRNNKSLEYVAAKAKADLFNIKNSRQYRILEFVRSARNPKLFISYFLSGDIGGVFTKPLTKTPSDYLLELGNNGPSLELAQPEPLKRLANMNVVSLCEESEELFGSACHSVVLLSNEYKILLSLNALKFASVSDKALRTPEMSARIQQIQEDGLHLIVLCTEFEVSATSEIIKSFNNSTQATYIDCRPNIPDSASYISTTHLPISKIDFSKPIKEVFFSLSDCINLASSVQNNTVIIIDGDEFSGKGKEIAIAVSNILRLIAGGAVVLYQNKRPNFLPNEAIKYTDKHRLTRLSKEPYAIERYSVITQRSVINRYNALSVCIRILQQVGVPDIEKRAEVDITVLLSTRREEMIQKILPQIDQQTIKPKKIVLLTHGFKLSMTSNTSSMIRKTTCPIEIVQCDKKMIFGDVLNLGLSKVSTEYVTKMDDDDLYGKYHLEDLYQALVISHAHIVGKWSNWVNIVAENKVYNWQPSKARHYGGHLPGATLLMPTALAKKLQFGSLPRGIDSDILIRAIHYGARLFSTHKYNFVRIRDEQGHTYAVDKKIFASKSEGPVIDDKDMLKSVFI